MEKPDTTMEVNHMETTMNTILPDTTAPAAEAPQPNAVSRHAPRAGRPGDDVVRWAEFRLALWIGGFALAVIISGQGFLYSAIMGLQGEMQTQIGDLRADTQKQFGELRVEMQTQFGELGERIVRIETHLGMDVPATGKGS